jgi:chromosome segregation ATPase
MFDELNRELIEIKEKLRVRQKLLGDIERTQSMLAERNSRLKDLESVLEKENADVKKLEGLSLNGLFHSILGDKQAQLDKERQEYLSAKLKYDECQYSISALGSEIESYKIRISSIGDLDGKYKAIVEKKEQLISQSSDENATKLVELSESLADTKLDMKELSDAIRAGKKALTGLDEVTNSLRSAKNWGTFDMLGGGLISTAVKHSRINSARESIHQVQQQLRVFQRELADVGSKTDIEINIGSFATFADYLFDGLIVDWIVQSKINQSLESTIKVSERIRIVLAQLQNSYQDTQTKLNNLEQKKIVLIEQT